MFFRSRRKRSFCRIVQEANRACLFSLWASASLLSASVTWPTPAAPASPKPAREVVHDSACTATLSSPAQKRHVSKVWRPHVTDRLLHDFTLSHLPHQVRKKGTSHRVDCPPASFPSRDHVELPLPRGLSVPVRQLRTQRRNCRQELHTLHATERHVLRLVKEQCHSCNQLFPVVR